MSKKKKAKWSNLTEAIQAGAPIDWVEFGERNWKARIRFADGRKIKGFLLRIPDREHSTPHGWDFLYARDGSYQGYSFLSDSWEGRFGWSLWVKGGIPLLAESGSEPVTADALPLGTCFLDMEGVQCFLLEDGVGSKVVCSPLSTRTFRFAHEVEVRESYGVGVFHYVQEGA